MAIMSTALTAAQKFANEYASKLRADDVRFQGLVYVQHEEGACWFLTNAFVVKHTVKYSHKSKSLTQRFYVVFTEHQGFIVFSPEEVLIRYSTKMHDGSEAPSSGVKLKIGDK